MDGTEYDIVVMGTGITESILSGLLSMEGNKILNIDKNPYYGDSGASLNLTKIWEVFKKGDEPPKELGHNREWNIDLTPKFVMAFGKLVKMMIKTEVSKYLNWKSVDGSYVYQMVEGGLFSKGGRKIRKVPGNDSEAFKSDLMGLLEKRRCQKLYKFVQKFDETNPSTYKDLNIKQMSFKELTDKFGLENNTLDFLGHAVALYTDNSYIDRPAIEVIKKIQLYIDSAGRFGDSPFIYPVYGLSGIPESFSRKSAVYGGTYMLSVELKKLEKVDGVHKLTGIWDGQEGFCTAKKIIAHPTYMKILGLENKLKKTSITRRSICILDHPINQVGECNAVQIILPQNQIKRNSDIYIMQLGATHGVCKKGFFIVIISTTKEKENFDEDMQEAFDIVGKILYRFDIEEEMYEAKDYSDNIFITSSLDATSHFESSAEDVCNVYKAITGKELDLTLPQKIEE